jgi:protein-disulfide isomerase
MRLSLNLIPLIVVCSLSQSAGHPGHDGPHDTRQQPGPQRPAPQSVVVVEYAGFDCKPCAEVSGLLSKLATKDLAIQILFKHSPGNPEALLAHEAALAAGQQGKFWEMHDRIFAGSVSNYAGILDLAKSLNLDMKRFQTAIDEREFRAQIITDMTEARGMGVQITPTLFINGTKLEGIDQIRAFVNQVMNPPEQTPDPSKTYEFDLKGSPATGPENAPVTIVEFSDFRCGFCGAHSRNIDELMTAYPGKIRRVFKHFPIQTNEEGALPHNGSMAAMNQGKFWEMYRALMNHPLKNQDDLFSRAVAIGLDMERFQGELGTGQSSPIVLRDIQEGDKAGIRMTPTSFINGKPLSGRQTLESLKMHVDGILGLTTDNGNLPGNPPGKVAAMVQPAGVAERPEVKVEGNRPAPGVTVPAASVPPSAARTGSAEDCCEKDRASMANQADLPEPDIDVVEPAK